MTDAHLNMLSKGIEGLIHQVAEEGQMVEDASIAFLQIILLEIAWQLLQEIIFLLKVELLPDVDTLLYVMVNLPLQFIREFILI